MGNRDNVVHINVESTFRIVPLHLVMRKGVYDTPPYHLAFSWLLKS